jgi:hypothetical protein
MFGQTIKYIYFHNNTDLPLMISSWVDGSNTLKYAKINSGQKVIVHSSVGEWHLDSMFDDVFYDDRKIWKDNGLEKHLIIGKFRSSPCASGNYSWLDYDEPFQCIYTKLDVSENTENFGGNILKNNSEESFDNKLIIPIKSIITLTRK